MPGYDDPNRPEWAGKRKAKNFARINAACKGLKTSGGKPPMECPKCGTSHKFAACPRVRMPAIKEEVMPCSSDKERALTVLGKWNTGIFHTGQKASNQKEYL